MKLFQTRSLGTVLGTAAIVVTLASLGGLAGSRVQDAVRVTTIGPAEHSAGADASTAHAIPPPQDLSQLVQVSNLIAVGEVVGMPRIGKIGAYDEESRARTEVPGDAISPRIDVSDFELRIVRTLKASSDVAAGDTVVLRLPGIADSRQVAALTMPSAGKTYLFFLTMNPDKLTYGHYHGVWGRMSLDTFPIVFGDVSATPVPFATGLNAEQFLDAIASLGR
jgi:hypothetical protein